MEADTFPRADVQKVFSRLVAAKINSQKDPKAFKEHKGRGIPLLILMDPDGKVWSRSDGKPPDLLQSLSSDFWNPGVELANNGKSIEAFEYWGRLVELFPETDLASQARGNIEKWEADPTLKSQMAEIRAQWTCAPLLAKVDKLSKKKDAKTVEEVRAILEKIVAEHAGTTFAAQAQERLDKLPPKKE